MLKKNAGKNVKGAKHGKPTAVVDGRADPAAAYMPWVTATKNGETVIAKAPLAKDTVRTEIAHQSGKGTRGERGSWRGVAKTKICVWCGQMGFDFDQTCRVLTACGLPMVEAVIKKFMRYGERGEVVVEIDRADANDLRRFAK